MLGKKTQSLLVALALLAAAELGLRSLRSSSAGALPADRPLVLVLGSSRAKAGVAPSAIEQVLERRGFPGAFAANLSVEGATTAGLYRRYAEELAPLAPVPPGTRAVLLIEARGSGLNDSYVTPEEAVWLERERLERDAAGQAVGVETVGPLELYRAGSFAAGSRALVGRLALANADELLGPSLSLHRLLGEGDPEEEGPAPTSLTAPWARGERGFLPYSDVQEPGLREPMWREHYQGTLLKDFHLGGMQTDFLRLLVRRARADGFRPVLFVMPVTSIHRGFFPSGAYAQYLAHVAAVAAVEGVPLVDLDTALGLPLESFVDTHHLRFSAVAPATVQLTERGVLPSLAGP